MLSAEAGAAFAPARPGERDRGTDMRKKLAAALAMALALALLCGCSSAGQALNELVAAFDGAAHGADTPAFDDIVYLRPNTETLKAREVAVELALANGESLSAVTDCLDSCYEEYNNFYTMYNLANIRACQDVTDAYYAAEYSWCDDNFSAVQQIMEDMFYACAASELAAQLEEDYFWEGFRSDYSDPDASYYSAGAISLMRRESSLLAEYRALVASPTIQGDGVEVDYNSYISELYDEQYRGALLQYYRKYNDELSRIYIDLVKVRTELASALGFDNYEQMQYSYYFERDYTPEQAAAYVADIKEYMVPFYKQVAAADPYADIDYGYLSGVRLHSIVGAAADNIGGQVDEAFDFMSEHGFYDIEVAPNKAAISFETYLTDYDAPFLFLDPYGDTEDILSYSHEFGHYVDAYVNRDAYETIDVSECFSQGMEYLMLSCYGEALSEEETDNLLRMKMMDTLELYVQQASFAEFESEVYSCDPDELSADTLNALSLRLAKEYGYYDGESADYYAMSWTDIVHFYELPFYIITYPVSNDVAMQLYELEQEREGLGMEKYLEMLPRDYEGFIDTLTAAGLESPFTPGRIEQVVGDLRAMLPWSSAAA